MLTFDQLLLRAPSGISLVKMTSTQSPTFERMVSGSAGLAPAKRSALCSLSTNSMPLGSDADGRPGGVALVTWIGSVTALTGKYRCARKPTNTLGWTRLLAHRPS